MDSVEKLQYRIPEAVEATGYSRSFLYHHIARGNLKVIRVGRTIRIARADLRAWIQSQNTDSMDVR